MKKVVLFGAGASHGSGDVHPCPTPLGNMLYKELKTRFPSTWGKLPSQIDKVFISNFEDGMYILVNRKEQSEKVPQLVRDMAKYFIEFKFTNNENLYHKFVRELKDTTKGIVYGTLNYDILFEQGLETNNLLPIYFEELPDKILLLKLHGSCNFLPPKGFECTDSRFRGNVKFIDYPIRVASPEETIQFCYSDSSISPTMCLYTKLKIAQFGHGQIEKIRQLWNKYVTNAEKILIIGARWHEEDTHIWDLLSETRAKLAFIGSKDSFDEWTNSRRDINSSEYLGYSWTDCFDAGITFLK